MPRLYRWITAMLAVCILINMIPVTAFAQDLTEDAALVEDLSLESSEPETTAATKTVSEETEAQETEAQETEAQETEAQETEAQEIEETEAAETQPEETESEEDYSIAFLELTDPFAVAFQDELNKPENSALQNLWELSEVKGDNGESRIQLVVEDGGVLGLLATQEPVEITGIKYYYHNWIIKVSTTGNITLSDDFAGLGSNDFPFEGKFDGTAIPFSTSQTIFKALSTKADLHGFSIAWSGTADKPILAEVLVADSAEAATVNMPLDSASTFSPYIGTLKGSQKVTLPKLNYSGADSSADTYSSDVGILCGSMESGSKLEINAENLVLPTEKVLTLNASGNVGGLVGSLSSNAELTISGGSTLTLNTNLTGNHVGGLVGCAADGAKIIQNPSIAVSTTINSTGSAGAVAGVVENGPLLGGTGTVTVGAVTINASNTADAGAGVLYGQYTTSEDYDLANIAFGSGTRQVSGYDCGGIFGKLTLTDNAKCTVSENITTTLNTATNYGGIVGTLEGARKNALIVRDTEVTTEASSATAACMGGLVGIQNATLDTKQSTITLNINASGTTVSDFGGLSAKVGDAELLLADEMTVSTNSNYAGTSSGGGVAGSTGVGSIVYLKTSLDLSKCALTTKQNFGQIVGNQNCSLVYAPDVKISRLNSGYTGINLDDIGNYGQLYYIRDFLTLTNDGTYATEGFVPLTQTNGEYVLKNETDYALLALAWQSHGAFATVSGITNGNWYELRSSAIRLYTDIDLSGCGIGGLSRDVSEDTFSGTFYGDGHTLTLDIGHQNDENNTGKGDGRICTHNAVGLFAELSGNASVENLTLAGTIRISNQAFSDSSWGSSNNVMSCGALAAKLSTDSNPINNVTTAVTVDAKCHSNYQLNIGGLFGLVASTVPSLTINSEQKAKITAACIGDGSFSHIGGVIGAIEGGSKITVTCSGNAKLGGRIECTGSVANNYAGGLIGTILTGGAPTVEITKLAVDGFSFTGNATQRMGGILGCIWADTTVNIDGLTVTGAELTANGMGVELGGLVYRASGTWTVSSADLSGLNVSAVNAKALGLMVCKGGTLREYLNNNSGIIMGGLYLVMSTSWETGYILSDPDSGRKISITCGKNTIFDEFVAYTAYADPAKSEPNYQITANGSGIISLTASKNKDGHLITYENRTDVPQKTNRYSRYYYNLPEVLKKCDSVGPDSPEELLIWSVHRYAASNLKSEFIAYSNSISGDLDMKGLSYYPISITNGNVTVQNATITFWNSEIEELEKTNKSTRGNSDSHSQHYTMHCGLFLNFTADVKNANPASELTLSVDDVSFAGSVGVVDGTSGALVCGTVAGESVDTKTSICKVILASADNESNAVRLDGISVEPSDADTRPVLIGSMGDYVSLEAQYLDYTNKQFSKKASGTSLIGNVGGTNAVSVKVDLQGTIKLPDKNSDGVFTGATLFNSLQFKNGSATYVFYKDKEYPNQVYTADNYSHNATYGMELSENKSKEYLGKEGCYNDGYGRGNYISRNGEFNSHMDFKDYLPYVRFSPVNSDNHGLAGGYHELAVNVLFENVTDGCGTYGDPYRITPNNVGMLSDIALYINTGKASNGWQLVVSNDNEYHTASATPKKHLTLTYNGTMWMNGDNPYNGDVQKHLASAYYCFDDNVELSGFSGFGANAPGGLPFTGVITGQKLSNGFYPKVDLYGSNGLINYSYGSVVRDLNVNWKESVSLTRGDWSPGSAEDAPKTFFGGVIGCVLGGDNIIENVAVTVTDVIPTETNPHLVPVGGYVGVIAGGGVLFRGNISDDTGISGNDTHLFYTNPIVGRVLGGYAFYEGDAAAPYNTDKNYTINTITAGKHLDWDGSTLIIKDGEGLLLLSAIVSSGAGSYGNSLAYKDGYGVARVARYNQIGKDKAIASSDYALTLTANTPIPYLLSGKFLEGTASQICRDGPQTGITLKLGDGPFDMEQYGNGYRGLSARYVSNASYTIKNNAKQMSPYAVVMRVKTFDGNDTTVSGISMDVKEYDVDDFHAASVGGIFNIVWTNLNTGGGSSNTINATSEYDSVLAQNLTIRDCTVKLGYYDDQDDNPKPQANYTYFTQADGISTVAVGGFIGTVNNLSSTGMNVTTSNYLFKKIRVDAEGRSTIDGPNSAGAIIGASGMGSNGYPGSLLTNGGAANSVRFGPSFLNCSYSNTDVTGYLAAGGMVGCAATGYDNLVSFGAAQDGVAPGCFATCTITDKNLIFAENSTIQTRSSGGICGGVFGGIGMRGRINEPEIYVDPKNKDSKPMVNYLTGLSILDSVEDIQTLDLKNVNLYAKLDFTDHIYYAQGAKNGVDKGDTTAVGGCIGRISHANPVRIYRVVFGEKDATLPCTIQASKPANGKVSPGNRYAGGLIGYGYTTKEMTIDNCAVYCTDIFGTRSGGLIARSGFSALNISNSAVEGCNINTQTSAGGLTGCFWDSNCSVKLFNILIKNTSVTNGNGFFNCGRLFGVTSTGKTITISAVGVSVFCEDNTSKLPTNDRAGYDIISNGSFLVYADYAGTSAKVNSYDAPYVVANPYHALDGTNLLTGDAVRFLEGSKDTTIATKIWKDHVSSDPGKTNYAPYVYVKSVVTAGTTDSRYANMQGLQISTFCAVQGEGPDTLPVLLLKDGNTKAITDYLDVITNGGYSNAGSAVSLSVRVYYWREASGMFTLAEDNELEDEPQSIVLQNNALKVNVKSYDNQRGRFTLVEAKFSVEINGAKKTYAVSIPVVVVRELQFVYNATLSYGKEFKAEVYPNLTNHLLESTGTPFTAYLTYQYNREQGTENTLTYAEYDWQGYMDGGGNMLDVGKKLIFTSLTSKLPKDTELTLLDCQNGNRAYSFKVGENSDGSVWLSQFTALDDGSPFQSSMAETLGVTSVPDSTGKYIQVSGEGIQDATVRLKDDNGGFVYYRLANEDETGTHRLTVPTETIQTTAPTENYFLLVTIPKQDSAFFMNGELKSELKWVNPSKATKLKRDNSADHGNGTVSTYQISSGYTQNLVSLDTSESGAIDLMDSTKHMKVQIQDTIIFNTEQVYNSSDDLFLKISVGLRETLGADSKDVLFPQGTTGTVKFYVQAGGKYFYYKNGSWSSDTPKQEAVSYEWTWNPERGRMNDLLLSEDGKTSLSLAQVRDAVKNSSSEIIVTAQMDIVMDETLLRAVVPTSDRQGVDNYACLQYSSQLSTTVQGLDYSTARDYAPKNGENSQKYYLGVTSEAVLSMDATDISQLGVNPLAPIPEYVEDGKSKIDCVISLDLENLQNLDSLLANIDSVTYQLALYKRDGADFTAAVGDDVRDAYISFQWPNSTKGWAWTITPTVGDYFNGKQFSVPLTANVSMDVADYANYKIGVTVTFNGKSGKEENVKVSADNAYIVYTYACIRPNFYAGS